MTTKEIKNEIQEALNNVPEAILKEVLDYLKSFKGKSNEDIQRTRNLSQILKEDSNLLRRLAE